MSLWGNKDGKTVAGSVVVNGATGAVTGTTTTFTNFEVGDFMNVGKNEYLITAITSDTAMTVESATGSAMKGASSNSAYVIQEKPIYVVKSMIGVNANTVFGVDTTEMAYANTADTEADAVPHAGWVLRTEGTGGRAGRVHYEVLVAGSSISGDNVADDSILPEEN